MVINPQFEATNSFSDGLAEVRIGDVTSGKWGYIDKTGKVVINPQFSGGDFGLFDAGKLISFGSFREGLAAVRIGDEKSGKWGFIGKDGRFVINPQFDEVFPFNEGLAVVRVGDNGTSRFGYIDGTGKYVINPQFDWTYGFDSGLALVRIGDDKTGKFGYIDKTGKFVVNPQFDATEGFTKDGLAVVKIAGKYGYITR